MSRIVEVYKPTFEMFHETPIVIWKESKGSIQVAPNLFQQYRTWKSVGAGGLMGPRHEPHPAFWESNGPAIVRALEHCNCVALVFEWLGDRKVSYRWFSRHMDKDRSVDWYHISSVTAEGDARRGSDTRVIVTLPTDEDVHFAFHNRQMQGWLKPEPPPETPPTEPAP